MGTVILKWTYAPGNLLSGQAEIQVRDLEITAGDGRAEVRIPTAEFDADNTLRQELQESLECRLRAIQVTTHCGYELSKPQMTREEPGQATMIFGEIEPIVLNILDGPLEWRLMDAQGNVVRDSRRDRIVTQQSIEVLTKRHWDNPLVKQIFRSYESAVRDPQNEMVHLYEIRDGLSKGLGGSHAARNRLGISRKSWSRFGQLANDEPLRQGRHRGANSGNLRDVTPAELSDVRAAALEMIEAYLKYLSSDRM